MLFHDPDDERSVAGALAPAAEALAWFKATVGFFPSEQVVILPASRGSVGATSFPGAVWLHRGELGPDFLRAITAHELGHFYWGMHVRGSPDRRFDWLMLANGIWIDHLYLAQRENRSLPEQWRRPGVW